MANMTGQSTRAAVGYSKKFWDALRTHLKSLGAAYVASCTGIKENTVASFYLGRSKGLGEKSLADLRAAGLVPQEIEALATAGSVKAEPLAIWTGEVRTVGQVVAEKGFSGATIRKWANAGKLDFVMKGRRYLIAVNEKYAALQASAKAILEQQLAQVTSERDHYKALCEQLQLECSWREPATHDSDAEIKVPEYVESAGENLEEAIGELELAEEMALPAEEWRRENLGEKEGAA